jgi:hypothetical protein
MEHIGLAVILAIMSISTFKVGCYSTYINLIVIGLIRSYSYKAYEHEFVLVHEKKKHYIKYLTDHETFLAHLVKGNVSFCHHLASVVH